jgi:hypothetical protein
MKKEQSEQATGGTDDRERHQLGVVYRPIAALTLDPKNPWLHSRHQVRQIARSIEAFGFNVPVLVDPQGRVIAGHGRMLAARRSHADTPRNHPWRPAHAPCGCTSRNVSQAYCLGLTGGALVMYFTYTSASPRSPREAFLCKYEGLIEHPTPSPLEVCHDNHPRDYGRTHYRNTGEHWCL